MNPLILYLKKYSIEILFLYKSIGRLPLHGCTETPMDYKTNKKKHISDPHRLRIKATLRFDVIHALWAIGRAVMYYALAAHAFIREIKYRYCINFSTCLLDK